FIKDLTLVFDEWLKGYRALLFKVIKAYAFQIDDQNDLFQEICLQVWKSIPNFRAESAVSTWLYRISLNTAIKWSAKEKKHIGRHHEIDHTDHVLISQGEPKDDRIEWLYSEIRKFDEVDRSLSLLLLEGYSYKKMAKIIGISESNIGVKIHRIKERLAKNVRKTSYYGV
ncbi:MAG: RNA polymerase sigma factor, partial [Bacteroidota bacterium]